LFFPGATSRDDRWSDSRTYVYEPEGRRFDSSRAVATMPYISIVKRCAFNVGIVPCGVEEGNIAKLNKGDRVQILSDKIRAPDGTEIYEVKFQQWRGWVDASDLSLENGEEK
jgi:hypothetical protein